MICPGPWAGLVPLQTSHGHQVGGQIPPGSLSRGPHGAAVLAWNTGPPGPEASGVESFSHVASCQVWLMCDHMWPHVSLPYTPAQATSGDPESTGLPDLPFLCGRLGVPTCSPFSTPSLWSPRSPSTRSQQVQTCDWPVVDGPANAGGGAAPGSTTKPQPVPKV